MIGTKLTIIMPCYNCEKTLRQAVESIYTQELDIPYEVVIVDDGSRDGTSELIESLAKEHNNIIYKIHDKNMGGGTARNTAVANSTGNIIFCLDSDDILPPKMLPKMVRYLIEKDIDGVCFGKSVFFNGDNIQNISHEVDYEGMDIGFEVLFTNIATPIVVNFMYTKESFYKAFEYPTNHGFDTQGYGFRYAANNLRVHVLKDSFYYHRVRNGLSYYLREYSKGNLSKNWYSILTENLYKFDPSVKEYIMEFNYSKLINNIHGNSIMDRLSSNSNIFNCELVNMSYEDAYYTLKDSKIDYDQLWCGIYCKINKMYTQSVIHFESAQKLGLEKKHIIYQMYEIDNSSLSKKEILTVKPLLINKKVTRYLILKMLFVRGINKLIREVRKKLTTIKLL